jgi:hypothetical protein
MILGFAHITKNIPVELLADAGIPNAPEKWPLMERQAKSHRISVQSGSNGPAIEFVEYDTGSIEQPGRLGLLTDAVSLRVRSLGAEVGFFCVGLGFCWGVGFMGGRLYLTSAIDYWKVSILPWVEDDAPIDPPLDIAGYAALAFYSNDVEADRDHLLKHGGRTPTEPFTVKLNREMKIVMLRSPEGTIIELIQVMP